jgi:hypothetical protein
MDWVKWVLEVFGILKAVGYISVACTKMDLQYLVEKPSERSSGLLPKLVDHIQVISMDLPFPKSAAPRLLRKSIVNRQM